MDQQKNAASHTCTPIISYSNITNYQGHIKLPKVARGHATYVNVKIQTWLPVPKISYAAYGYTMFEHAQFTRASGCKSHSHAIKQIHGRLQPSFPYTVVANIRKMPLCLNLDIHVTIYGSYMPLKAAQYVLAIIDYCA